MHNPPPKLWPPCDTVLLDNNDSGVYDNGVTATLWQMEGDRDGDVKEESSFRSQSVLKGTGVQHSSELSLSSQGHTGQNLWLSPGCQARRPDIK